MCVKFKIIYKKIGIPYQTNIAGSSPIHWNDFKQTDRLIYLLFSKDESFYVTLKPFLYASWQ